VGPRDTFRLLLRLPNSTSPNPRQIELIDLNAALGQLCWPAMAPMYVCTAAQGCLLPLISQTAESANVGARALCLIGPPYVFAIDVPLEFTLRRRLRDRSPRLKTASPNLQP
jgi:hypothetical protein